MGKIAFVFAGQGAQAPGMGFDFCQSSGASREVFATADQVRPGTSDQCFHSSDEVLQETKNTQPCLYTVEMAIAAALSEAGIQGDLAAGFSLGELSALTYAGVFNLREGLSLVKARGELMQQASSDHQTSMAAVIKLTEEQVIEACSHYEHIYPVNFNCPGQITCSGDASEMERFAETVKEAGGKARILKVSGAFHSPYMSEAAEGFGKELEKISFAAPEIPVYSNYTGSSYPADIAAALKAQIDHPVKWETIIRRMIQDGADTFVEIGPGKTLTGLIKRIDPEVRLFNVSVPEELDSLKAGLLH